MTLLAVLTDAQIIILDFLKKRIGMTRPILPAVAAITIERDLGQMIGRIARDWCDGMNQRLKPFGLNVSLQQVLIQLHRNPGKLIQSDLTKQLRIEHPTLVRLLNTLRAKR